MYIVSTKLNKKKILLSVVIVGALLFGILVGIPKLSTSSVMGNGEEKEMSLQAKNMKTNEDRVNYLTMVGWEINPEALEIAQVQIPKEFDEMYESYNMLQKEQGFNLEKYKGKELQLFRYGVLNHPSGEEGVTANILIYKDKVVGGDVSSADMDGFIHGLNENLPEMDQDKESAADADDQEKDKESATDADDQEKDKESATDADDQEESEESVATDEE